jgi:hypothetical protein
MSAAYKKHTHREHILELPDTYVGSVQNCSELMYVVEEETFTQKAIAEFNPGFYKLFDFNKSISLCIDRQKHLFVFQSYTKKKKDMFDNKKI